MEVPNAKLPMPMRHSRITSQRLRRYNPNTGVCVFIEQGRYQMNHMTGVFHIAYAKLQFAMDKSLQAVEVN